MKEKMKTMTFLEAGKKELEAQRSELESKDREIQQLKNQLRDPLQLQEQFEECQRTLQQVQQDNGQLQVEFQRRHEELEQSRAMVSHVNTIGQPSITSAMDEQEKLVTPSSNFFNVLWFWESQGSVPRDIF
jgi:predicted nuclease with TOPRIM domain